MKATRRFIKKMLVLVHVTGGQPERGPEILSIRYSNTTVSKIRNLFIKDGLFYFVTLYYKGYGQNGKHRIIQRYVPRKVRKLILRYLWLALPLMNRLLGIEYGRKKVRNHV